MDGGRNGGRERVLVAMSGGVDSSVAAALLVEAGHEVVGVTMKTFCYDENQGPTRTCCGLDGIMDAKAVASRLGIAHYVFDVEEEFTRDVIDDFVDEYARGRTPNPCVRCNSNTKFRDLMKRGRALGCDAIATGHYVRVEHPADPAGGPSRLLRGADHQKDQAYFLWGLPPELLPLLRFPLGSLDKPAVRELARARDLVTAEKPESQEICFVPTGDYRGFLGKRLAPRHPALEPGTIVSLEGEQLGEHRGYAGFTVGQRRGLGGGFPERLFVVEVRPETREVVVGPREALDAGSMVVEEVRWLAPFEGSGPSGAPVGVQIRHRAGSVPARLFAAEAGAAAPEAGAAPPSRVRVEFEAPQSAVTPGQSAVFFDGDRVLGGGRISAASRSPLRRPPSPSAHPR
ncbi:MAG: tRNA 2-thiouridine(34) synthase MnmA [Gemmatimonadales bacterium]|nr:MAG: tRNA 2-thiouridine(34) synthase MnmA [Gemmatimonadales bacterium]